MSKAKLQIWLILSFLGLAGVFSLLLSNLPLDNLPPEIVDNIDPKTLKLLILINPAILTLVFTLIGTLVYDKVGLTVPIIENFITGQSTNASTIGRLIKNGLQLGLIAGILIVGISFVFKPYLPGELLAQSEQTAGMHLLSKLLYGGITEELLMRYGLMSVVALIINKLSGKLTNAVYYTSIVIAALLFALGHFPALFAMVAQPTAAVYAYIILGNVAGGLLFGYAYWKQGLESAMMAHATAHIVMTGGEALLG